MTVSILLILLFILLMIIGLLVFNKQENRWKVLLFGSILFYLIIAKWASIAILLFSLIVFLGGKIVEKTKRPIIYFAVIALGLSLLLVDKFGLYPSAGLPSVFTIIGISYITFNGLSYLFDIRKGYLKPETNYGLLLLYLLYFPYISAGPLHRYKRVVSQFKNGISLSNENFSLGFRLILWGVFKNLVLAQYLMRLVIIIIDFPDVYKGFYVLLGGFFFFIYLYSDFSSYIDIIRGTSQIFGIKLSQNFRNRVYASTSRKHFWEGWHMTLNHWFRDYVFYRLTSKARKKWQIELAMLFTFLLIGIWHEVSWKFLIWGFMNGIWIITENKLKKYFQFIPLAFREILGTIYHISIASCIAIVFRSNDAMASVRALFSQSVIPASNYIIVLKQIIYISPFFILMDYFYRKAGERPMEDYFGTLSLKTRWAIYVLLSICILVFGISKSNDAYYMQF